MKDKYHAAWKEKVIAYLGGICTSCQSTESLEIDHIDESTKSFNVSGYRKDLSDPLLISELAKCQCLCKECHKAKSAEYVRQLQLAKGFEHGTYYAWQKKKCVCELCMSAKREWYDKRNAKRRAGHKTYDTSPAVCGTAKKYKQGCKCQPCKDANAVKVREQRQSLKTVQ